MIKKKVIRNKNNYDFQEEKDNEGNIIDVSNDEDHYINANKKKEKKRI